jgi:hypothetical protein
LAESLENERDFAHAANDAASPSREQGAS